MMSPAARNDDASRDGENFAKMKARAKPQTHCPIMGGEIDKKFSVDYQGKRIYFCCPGCEEQFLEDADKHLTRMKAEGIVLEEVPHDH
jgi:YHS domain-containing protein